MDTQAVYLAAEWSKRGLMLLGIDPGFIYGNRAFSEGNIRAGKKTMAETTIKDIARLCGCSVSTVSRALNNHPDINPETRQKIMQVIRETGFVPNNSAINLKKTDSRAVALLVKGITNPFFNTMIKIMEHRIEENRYSTTLRHVEADEEEVQVALELVKERRLRGIVFLGGNFVHEDAMLRQLKVPFVFSTIGAPQGEPSWYANVSVDDVAESEKMVNYLIEQGHRSIAIIGDNLLTKSVGQLRFEGYRRAIAAHGLKMNPDLIEEAPQGESERYTIENGYRMAWKLIHSGAEMTAIFCTADVFAIGACRAAADAGLAIPKDISIVGYDGISTGDFYIPRLTTVRQPVEQMAEATITLLFDMIGKKRQPQTILMPAELVIRESSGSGYRK